jgi:hypothetical protein
MYIHTTYTAQRLLSCVSLSAQEASTSHALLAAIPVQPLRRLSSMTSPRISISRDGGMSNFGSVPDRRRSDLRMPQFFKRYEFVGLSVAFHV